MGACYWRREGDSNSRVLSDKQFSGLPRYSHFGIPPKLVEEEFEQIQPLCIVYLNPKPYTLANPKNTNH